MCSFLFSCSPLVFASLADNRVHFIARHLLFSLGSLTLSDLRLWKRSLEMRGGKKMTGHLLEPKECVISSLKKLNLNN